MGFRVIALVATYNEEDIVGQVVADLIGQGVEVYLIDDGSTDGTVAAVEPWQGRGVVGIERLPHAETSRWADLLRRKGELQEQLDADWFLHHDADELRESPWEGLSLRDAIARVDRLGWNAIDFQVLDFQPTHDGWRKGDDPRAAFTHWAPPAPHDKLRINAWKKAPRVDLVSSGGHEARFPGRRVFPIRFLLRHYSIRSQAHGERKVFAERGPRWGDEGQLRGWNVHYGQYPRDAKFVRDPTTLAPYDGEAVRAELFLRHRGVEELEAALADRGEAGGDAASRAQLAETGGLLAAERERAEQALRDLDARNHEVERLAGDLDARNRDLHARNREAEDLRREVEHLGGDVAALQRRLSNLLASRSWRWMAPVRALLRALGAG